MRILILLLSLIGILSMQPARAQDDDSNFLSRFISEHLSSAGRTVVVSGFEGALSSNATVAEITVADDQGVWLTLRGLVLNWNRLALLRGQFSVNEFSADEIIVARAPAPSDDLPDAEAEPFSLPELPVSVNIGQFDIGRLELGPTVLGQPVEARATGNAALADGEGSLTLQGERTDGQAGTLRINGSYANESRQLSLDLALSEGPGGLAATSLGIPGQPPLDISVQGEGSIDDFAADIRLASDGQDRIAGHVATRTEPAPPRADGTAVEGLLRHFDINIGGDIRPILPEQYHPFFGPDMRLSANAVQKPDGAVDVDNFSLQAAALSLNGRVVVALTGVPGYIGIKGEIHPPEGSDGTVLLPFGEVETRIGNATLDVTYDSGQSNQWQANLLVNDVARTEVAIGNLTLDGSGTIIHPSDAEGRRVDGQLHFGANELALTDPALARAVGDSLVGRSVFSWRQSEGLLRMPVLALNGMDYSVAADATIAGLQSALKISGNARAEILDASRFSDLAGRDLSGAANATVEGSYEPLSGMFDGEAQINGQDLTVAQPQADAMLAGATNISVSAKRDQTGILLRNASLEAQTLSIDAEGRIARSGSAISASLNFDDASVLGEGFGGALTADLRATQADQGTRVTLEADGRDMRMGQPQLDALLRGQARVSLSALVEGTDRVTVDDLQITAPNVTARASGLYAPGATDMTAEVNLRELGSLGAGLDGSLNATARAVDEAEGLRLTMDATANQLGVGNPQANLLLRGESRMSANVLQQPDGLIRVDNFDFANPQITANATGQVEGTTRSVTVNARLADLGLLVPGFNGPVTMGGDVVEEGGNFNVNLTAQGPGQINATAQGTIASNMSTSDLTVQGSAQLGLINPFISPRSVQGGVNFNLRMQGPPGLNAISGNVQASGIRAVDQALGIALNNGQATVSLASGQATVNARAGFETGGAITAGGTVGLTAPFPSNLTVTLNGAQFADPRLYKTILDGQVTITGPLTGGGNIGGTINVGTTEIRIPESLAGTFALPDMTHVAEPADVHATRVRAGLVDEGGSSGAQGSGAFGLDLTINAPSRIFVRGRGLEAELGGSIRIGGDTANVIPSGQFNLIRGRLNFLDRRFELNEGRIDIQGNLVPIIRFVATTDLSNGLSAEIVVEGVVSDPDITVTSQPELPEEEILSQIIFGRDLSSISPIQAAQLASAVATLAGRGGDGIISRLRGGFGLDNLDVVTDSEGNSGVRAGRYLSDDIYSEIVVGSRETTAINLNLDITSSLTARGSVREDGNTSIGIHFERDY